MNKNPGTRIICEWCGKFIIGKRKRFCDRKNCQNPYQANNQSVESRKKKSDSMMGERNHFYGKHHTEDTKKLLHELNAGENNPNYGKSPSEETRRKLSEAKSGSNHPMYGTHWCDYEYDPDKPCEEYRKIAFECYGYGCCVCGKTTGKIEVHHIDGNHNNDNPENLAPLCTGCHNKAHPNKTNSDSTPSEEFTRIILECRGDVSNGKVVQ